MPATDWRSLVKRYPEYTLIRDPAAYADVFDAIEEAAARARTIEPSFDEFELLHPAFGDVSEEELEQLVVWRVPVVPVRTANTVRLCIGLLQYWRWPVERPTEGAGLPHVDTLLKRNLQPTAEELTDLAAFLTTRLIRAEREDYTEPSAPILSLIERSVEPPAPAPLADVLREACRRVEVCRQNYVSALARWRGRPHTKRFDKWQMRLRRLIGE